ncbi:MAG: response regulator transcription factor [Ardenticatenaceae bacterium]|nr:response regulator transcription factor [Anaerolineales bacterium]MCB8942065.1 response regulator transcription factor [Ardenticatenaceae bacterium]MCB8973175.1 response regulator transcription factor [Ardenticatenaceae bacterium]
MVNKETVLVIDDSREMLLVMKHLLMNNGYKPLLAENGLIGMQMVAEHNPDLIVLDLNMPVVDGWEVCEQIREKSAVPIIILTAAHVTSEDTVRGLELGANDYVIKPFNQQVMVARIRSALRWSVKAPNGILYEDDILSINVHKREVVKNGELLKLTKKEFALLVALVTESPAIVNHEELFAKVWDETYAFDVNYVRIFVGHLRKKLESDPANPEYIHNERGVGYRFEHISEPDAASA